MTHLLAITYFMAFLGLWAVSLVESVGGSFIAFSAVVTAASLYFNLRIKKTIPAGAWNVLALASLAFFILDCFVLKGQIAASAASLLSILLAFKLFALKRNRDYLMAFGLVLFELLAAASSTVSVSFFLILALYVISSIWAMIIFSMRRDIYEAERHTELPPGVPGARFFLSVVVLSAACLVITLALFFTLPRMGIGLFERRALNTVKVTGFTDTVDIGSIGPVKEDPTVVMRVSFPSGRPELPVYFRGLSFDRYDGKSWSVGPKRTSLAKRAVLGFEVGRPAPKLTEQTVLLEPLETEVIFAASNPVRVEGAFTNLKTDGTGTMRLTSPPLSGIEYRSWSDLTDVRKEGPRPSATAMDDSYLERSPEGGAIRALAVKAAAGATPLERARSIEHFLKKNYRYKLSTAEGSGKTPLEDFLLRSKEGYCEHFATAMAMMLRASGIPSMVITGFLEGEWNDLGGYFMIRQQDAHSWVEAYIDGTGWMRFDPTPSAAAARRTPSLIALYLDLASLKWNSYIIQYSFVDQRQATISAEEKATGALQRLKKILRGGLPAINLKAGAAAAMFVALLGAAYPIVCRGWNRKKLLPEYYAEMLRILAKRRLVRANGETPLEFAFRTGKPDAEFVTGVFLKERYGGSPPRKEEIEEAMMAVARLKADRSPFRS